jgi:hypothetical protein
MRRPHQYWSSLAWSLWIVVFGVSAAIACVDHPAAPDETHPLLCIDSSSPVAQRDDKPIFFADAGVFPLPPKFSNRLVPLSVMGIYLPLALGLLTQECFQTQERISSPVPRSFLPVFRL